MTRLTELSQGIGSYDISAAMAYMVVTQVLNPSELYQSTMDFEAPVAITRHNAEWLQDRALSYPTAHRLRRDTLDIQYWVMPPTFMSRGMTYPLMVAITWRASIHVGAR